MPIERANNRVGTVPPVTQERLPFPERSETRGPPHHILPSLVRHYDEMHIDHFQR